LNTTQHFEDAIADRQIPREWCERVARQPLQTEIQPNGRIRCWALIGEVGRYLRVVLLEDGVTLHTAYFDRNYGKKVNG